MTTKELIDETHKDLKKLGYSKNIDQSEEIFKTVINNIINNIAQGITVKVDQLGVFESSLKNYALSLPKAKDYSVTRFTIRFKPAIPLKKRINEKIHKK